MKSRLSFLLDCLRVQHVIEKKFKVRRRVRTRSGAVMSGRISIAIFRLIRRIRRLACCNLRRGPGIVFAFPLEPMLWTASPSVTNTSRYPFTIMASAGRTCRRDRASGAAAHREPSRGRRGGPHSPLPERGQIRAVAKGYSNIERAIAKAAKINYLTIRQHARVEQNDPQVV
jgi:hypothetical protein